VKWMSLLLLLSAFWFSSCKVNVDSPVTPEIPVVRKVYLPLYGERNDSTYIKVFSDSSWIKYGGWRTVNGNSYLSIVDRNNYHNYYNVFGNFSGYDLTNHTPIIFQTPLPFLSDSLVIGQEYKRNTSFLYQGYTISLLYTDTVVDTVSITIPLGRFSNCLKFRTKTEVWYSGNYQSATDSSVLAPHMGIIFLYSSGIYFVRGTVNGHTY